METYKFIIAKNLINGNWNLSSKQETQMNKISKAVDYAWNNWDDEILKTYYKGEKPNQPTSNFIKNWVDNEDFEADGYDVKHLEEIFN